MSLEQCSMQQMTFLASKTFSTPLSEGASSSSGFWDWGPTYVQ